MHRADNKGLKEFMSEEQKPTEPDADRAAFMLHVILAVTIGHSAFKLHPPSVPSIVTAVLAALELLAATAAATRARVERPAAIIRATAYGLLAAFLLVAGLRSGGGALASLIPLAVGAGGWAVHDRMNWPRWLSLPFTLLAGVVLVIALRAMAR